MPSRSRNRRVLALTGCLLALCQVGRAGDAPTAPALDKALATVLAAQPGSVRDAKIAAAWQVVSRASYDQLPALFAALDRADPLAANWLSMALDRITASQSAAGRTLPISLLQETALGTSHALLTRKTAIHMLEQVDQKSLASLQAKLLHDPVAELRRPAVQAAIDEARKMAQGTTPKSQQLAKWKTLLNAARDPDQVNIIAKAMKSLGEDVDVAAHFGYLVDWYVIGPFDNTDGTGFDKASPPETLTLDSYQGPGGVTAGKTEPGKSGPVAWKKIKARPTNGDVSLNKEVAKLRDVLAYGATVFVSEKDQRVDVRLRVQNSFKIWINGKLIVSQPVGHTGNSFDQYIVQADLKQGKNLLLIKSCQVNLRGSTPFYDNWHFCVRVCDATGGAILSTDRVTGTMEN